MLLVYEYRSSGGTIARVVVVDVGMAACCWCMNIDQAVGTRALVVDGCPLGSQ